VGSEDVGLSRVIGDIICYVDQLLADDDQLAELQGDSFVLRWS
jgi:hypothetical protein